MGRRVVLLLLLLGLAPGVALGAKPGSWAAAEIRSLGQDPASFRADDPVTRGDLAGLLAEAGVVVAPPAAPDVQLTMQDLNARLVAALGARDVAGTFLAGARAAGLSPPSRFGTEATARLLGLRKNHPAKEDALERGPTTLASRAEAAYSAARIKRFRGWEVARVREASATFSLPALTDWQRRLLATAFGLVGHPYVWGGTTERAQAYAGAPVPGGFDCSGFVWRVFKQAYGGSGALAATLRGRTSYAMSGEVPKARRIPIEALRPADLVFFGAKGPRSAPAEVDHMGIYAGGGWLVHSSRYGVALERLSGWYRERFAWGRRPLAEAGLAGS